MVLADEFRWRGLRTGESVGNLLNEAFVCWDLVGVGLRRRSERKPLGDQLVDVGRLAQGDVAVSSGYLDAEEIRNLALVVDLPPVLQS